MSFSEAMLFGKRLGVDPQVLTEIINNSTGRCWSSEEGGFVTKLAHKDLAFAVSAAEEANVPLAVEQFVEETYRPLARSKQFGERDFSVTYEALDSLGASAQSSKL